MLRTEAAMAVTGGRPQETSGAHAESNGGAFDFEDLQALREEYEERLRRLTREKDAALDVVRKDAGQRMAALRAEQDARLAAEGMMRQELIEELTIELAAAREEGERVARDADRRRVEAEHQARWALGELDRLGGELARVRETLRAFLAPPNTTTTTTQPPALPAEALVVPTTPPTSSAAAAFGARRKRIRLR